MSRPAVLNHLSTLADPTRSRILLVLSRHELMVAEACSVLQLPQSTVSRHLRVLADDGWVHSRAEGTHRLYKINDDLDLTARGLWRLAEDEIAATPAARQDLERLAPVLARRRTRSREFFATAAGQWDQLRDNLFGPRVHTLSLLGLLSDDWTVADLGCGTGAVTESLAPFVHRVIGVDGSEAMIETARERLQNFANVELRHGELETLPIGDNEVDTVTLILVLHHLPDPDKVLAEVARILRPGGKLLLVDMLPHDRHEYQQQMGHVWLGFSEPQIARLMTDAGLKSGAFRPLPADPAARGPTLFAATAAAAPEDCMTTFPRLIPTNREER